jgi:uncharacterized repeat protein (TIGR03803 family)
MGAKLSFGIVTFAAFVAQAMPAHAGWKYSVLFAFSGANGATPQSGLIADSAGNLYGTTWGGGRKGLGTVFKLSAPPVGEYRWTRTALTVFSDSDGAQPYAGLMAAADGSLFGTTTAGGKFNAGTIFRLTPPISGNEPWTRTVLHEFGDHDGRAPYSGLIADGAGNLYGSTTAGGAQPNSAGTIFRLSPPADGSTKWRLKVLYDFTGAHDLNSPIGSLVFDHAGNLYGTLASYKVIGGAVFELSPPQAGASRWAYSTIFRFDGRNGSNPYGTLLIDQAGNLFGTSGLVSGGYNDAGLIYELSPPSPGSTKWTRSILKVLHGRNGSLPYAGLVADTAGNLYATTYFGGRLYNGYFSGWGVVLKLSPPAVGQSRWSETILESFGGRNGERSTAPVLLDRAGNLYGTTTEGGIPGDGVVFRLSP